MARELIDWSGLELQDRVVHINRCTKVVKGGKNLSFSALVVVGDGKGCVGFGMGKAREVPSAIAKGIEKAKRNLVRIPLRGTTIPHAVIGRHGSGQVLLRPAAQGTGIIAGGSVRAVLESAGIRDVLTKVIGSNNPHNVVRATFEGLQTLRSARQVARDRGKELHELAPEEAAEEAAARAAAEAAAAQPPAPVAYTTPDAPSSEGEGGRP